MKHNEHISINQTRGDVGLSQQTNLILFLKNALTNRIDDREIFMKGILFLLQRK